MVRGIDPPRTAPGRSPGGLAWRQALLPQLLLGSGRFLQALEAHAPEHPRGLRELDVAVLDDLPAVAPRVDKVQSLPGEYLHVQPPQRPPDRLPVVHDDADVAVRVRRLRPLPDDGDKLVPGVDKRHLRPAPAQLEVEDAPVELERRVDVVDLDGHVVEPDQPGAWLHGRIILPRPARRHPADP